MSYNAREQSRTQGQPVSLYFIRYGDTPDAFYAYTSAEQPITHTFDVELGLVTFEPMTITRGEITASGSLDRASLEVRMPLSAGLNHVFELFPPSQVVTLVIFDGHHGEPDFKVVWMGRMLGQSYDAEEAVYNCEPASTSLKRPGLQRNWSRGCPHVLYGQGSYKCNANRAAATVDVQVNGVDGALLILPNGWASDGLRPSYVGGIAEWLTTEGRTERRTILAAANGQVTLSGPVVGLEAGMPVSLSLGCAHNRASCLELHNNIHNYGGQDWIPTKNPIGIVNNFY